VSNENKSAIKKGILAGLTELEDLALPQVKTQTKATTGKKYRESDSYLAFADEDVADLQGNGLSEASFDIGKQQLQKLKRMLELAGLNPDDHLFNPGLGHNHRQMNIPRITLKEHSQALNMAIEMLYEVYFSLLANGQSANDIFAEDMSTQELFDRLKS